MILPYVGFPEIRPFDIRYHHTACFCSNCKRITNFKPEYNEEYKIHRGTGLHTGPLKCASHMVNSNQLSANMHHGNPYSTDSHQEKHYPPRLNDSVGQEFAFVGLTRTCSDRLEGADSQQHGFNGKEKESDGTSDNYDFGARIYDARLGRWLGLDPKWFKYPQIAPFVYCSNSPSVYIDMNGEEIWIGYYGSKMIEVEDPKNPGSTVMKEEPFSEIVAVKYEKGKLYDKNGKLIKLRDIKDKNARKYIKAVKKDLVKLDILKDKDPQIASVINALEEKDPGDNSKKHLIRNDPSPENGNGNHQKVDGYKSTTDYDPFSTTDTRGNEKPGIVSLSHELWHAYSKQIVTDAEDAEHVTPGTPEPSPGGKPPVPCSETDAINFENVVRRVIHNEYKRTKYSGYTIPQEELPGKGPEKIDPHEK